VIGRIALTAAMLAACGEPPLARPPPVVAVDGKQTDPVEVPPRTQLPEKEVVDYEPCVATMFDHEAGQHDRFVVEDAGGLHGYQNAAGEMVIAPRFLFAYSFSPEGVAAVIEDGVPAYIDPQGRVIAQAFLYDNGPDYFTEGRARVVVEGKVGFIDRFGKIAVAPRYDYAAAFCHGLAVVCTGCAKQQQGEHASYSGGKWGFVDRQGRVAIPLRYDAVVERFDPDVAVVVLEGREIRIDREGRALE
jgi:hypothetical protein